MARQTEDAEHFRQSQAGRRQLRIAPALLGSLAFIGGICLLVGRWSGQSLERRIAAVNARHALAPEQNAVTIYDRLLASDTLTGNPADPNLTPASLAGLLEASKLDSCWFTIAPGFQGYRDHAKRLEPMREWARALERAARRDLALGELEAATEKLRCIVQMARHLRQQGVMLDFLMATGLEGMAMQSLDRWIMEVNAPPSRLDAAEALSDHLASDWKLASQPMQEVQPLLTATAAAELGLRQRLRSWWDRWRGRNAEKSTEDLYLRLVASRRGVRLLVGLRRYHDAHGRWPEQLDDLRLLVPAQALIDPYTGQLFVYKTAESGFRLYVKGPNRIDENGSRTGAADDWQIWPLYSPPSAQTQAGKQQ